MGTQIQLSVFFLQQLEKGLERYNCQLSKDLSSQASLLGLEEGKTVCSLVYTAVGEYIRRKCQPDPDLNV